jgi:ornithine carbamoyltransferase
MTPTTAPEILKTARHFLDLSDFTAQELRTILNMGKAYKNGAPDKPMADKTLAMIFEKPSTRTRVSFEIGAHQLGGNRVLLSPNDSQLGRGETIADTARVLAQFVDMIMIRTDAPQKMLDLALYSGIPVINGLTDDSHPCQVMADIMTYEEHRGDIKNATVAWIGDGNNVAHSWIHAAALFGCKITLACPQGFEPKDHILDWAKSMGAQVQLCTDPAVAVQGSDLVLTDTWVSMGDEEGNRHDALQAYQVNTTLMQKAAENALFMHCLPAHRGEEVTDEVMDGPQSVVWDEAQNRLHAQKGVMSWCMNHVF